MSVTFSPTGSTTTFKPVPCDFRECCPENRCGFCTDGIYDKPVRTAPELNVANLTGAMLLRFLGLFTNDADWQCGEAPAEMIGTLRQRVMLALNSKKLRAAGNIEPSVERESRIVQEDGVARIEWGPTIYNGGRSDAQIIDRLTRLDEVLAYCQQQGVGLSWS